MSSSQKLRRTKSQQNLAAYLMLALHTDCSCCLPSVVSKPLRVRTFPSPMIGGAWIDWCVAPLPQMSPLDCAQSPTEVFRSLLRSFPPRHLRLPLPPPPPPPCTSHPYGQDPQRLLWMFTGCLKKDKVSPDLPPLRSSVRRGWGKREWNNFDHCCSVLTGEAKS